MRIGIDASCWSNRRGFGRFVRELLGAIAKLNTGDEFILFADQQTAQASEFPEGWKVVVGQTAVAATEAAASDGRRTIRDMWTMRQLVHNEPMDLMFFPAVYSYFPVKLRQPCLVTLHDVIAETLPHLVFETRRSRWFWNLKCRHAVRQASRIVTVSQASKQGLMKVFGLKEDKLRVLSEAAAETFEPVDRDTDTHKAVLSRYGLKPDARFFLYVGGISPHKNIDTLIDGFAQAVGTADELADVQLVLVGDLSDVFRTCHAQLKEQIDKLGLTGRVTFPGFVGDGDLVHLYSGAQAFVMPSYLEGFGLPAVEAMACGAPVVASDRGSLPEVLDGAGYLFEAHDTAALGQGLNRVLVEPGYQADLRSRSLERSKSFSWEQSAGQAMDIFREAVNNRVSAAGSH